MTRFMILLTQTLILSGLWLVTGVTAQVSPRSYLDLSAPWWHMALHVAWFATGLATSLIGVSMILDWQSKQKELASKPPQNT